MIHAAVPRRFMPVLFVLVVFWASVSSAQATRIKLADGKWVEGTISRHDAKGVFLSSSSGGSSLKWEEIVPSSLPPEIRKEHLDQLKKMQAEGMKYYQDGNLSQAANSLGYVAVNDAYLDATDAGVVTKTFCEIVAQLKKTGDQAYEAGDLEAAVKAYKVVIANKDKIDAALRDQLEKEHMMEKAKGLVEFNGQWITPDQKKKAEEKAFVAAQHEKGLIKFEDKWMTPQEKKQMETERAAAQERERLAVATRDDWISATEKESGMQYYLYVPKKYDKRKSYPIVLYLHPTGCHFSPGTVWASGRVQSDHPCFVLFPDICNDCNWVNNGPWEAVAHTQGAPTPYMSAILRLIAQFRKDYSIDSKRLYVTGTSNGGFGTWDIITREPDLFAAAAPCCGGADNTKAPLIAKKVAIWASHCQADKYVRVSRTTGMIQALKDAGGNPKMSIWDKGQHGEDEGFLYNETDFIEWLFKQKK